MNMRTPTPFEATTQFAQAMNRGDIETALGLYEPSASLVVKPGVVVTGTPALREALKEFAALKPVLTSEGQQIVEAGDVALSCVQWTLRGTDPAGNPVRMSGRSADIIRRQTDGNWLIALDNPWGTDIVASPGFDIASL
jgi:ketosteroid isomerase-like protein